MRDDNVVSGKIQYNIRKASPLIPDDKTYEKGQFTNYVIKKDFDTVELRTQYNRLLKEQTKNPISIIIDSFFDDSSDNFYLKATVVHNKKEFKQRTIYFPNLEPLPSKIKFLEKACKNANKLHKRLKAK